MKYVLKSKQIIESTLADTNRNLSIPGIFSICQNIGMKGADKCGLGRDKTMDKGLLWVITKSKLVIENLPKYSEKTNILTYPNPINKFIYPRQYVLTDNKNNVYFKMVSLFALIRESDRKIVLPKDKIAPYCKGTRMKNELVSPQSLKEMKSEFVYETLIRASDIDLNHHMNNCKYIEAIINAHDTSYYNEHQIKELQIDYLHEIKENTLLQIFSTSILDNKEQIIGKVDNKTVFISEITYKQ